MSSRLQDAPQTTPNAGAAPETSPKAESPSVRQLVLGLLWGVAFGFLLQKGGVAKFHVLIGQLLLIDFTVVKVMLSAVVVGMIGIHFMHRLGLVEMHIKPIGARGKLTLFDWIPAHRSTVVLGSALLLTIVLFAIETLFS